MRPHERRKLLIIEQNLLAEAPELAALFETLARPGRHVRGDLVARWFSIGLLVLGLALEDVIVLLGAFALLSFSILWWIGWSASSAAEFQGEAGRPRTGWP